MYYEEKEIDGYLYWRTSPTGDWLPLTLKKVTERYLLAKRQYQELYQLHQEEQS